MGRLVTTRTPEMCKKINELILADRRVTVFRIANEMDFLTVWNMVLDHLQMFRVNAKHTFKRTPDANVRPDW